MQQSTAIQQLFHWVIEYTSKPGLEQTIPRLLPWLKSVQPRQQQIKIIRQVMKSSKKGP